MSRKKMTNVPREIKVYGSIIIGLIVLFYVYYFSTRFTTVITVHKEDIVHTTGRYIDNMIGTTSGEVYKVSSNALIGAFNSAEILNNVEKGNTYRVTGYGRRVPALGLYPVIVSIKDISHLKI